MRIRACLLTILTIPCSAIAATGQLGVYSLERWPIVVAGDAIPSERYAAEEFQDLWQKTTGFEAVIQHVAPPSGGCIAIGSGAAGAFDAPNGDLGEEGLRIRIAPEGIAITGGRPRGALYGVYAFFERYFGVRFLTADHTHIPKAKTAFLPVLDYDYRPPFSFRWSWYQENHVNHAFATRLRVNTIAEEEHLGGRTPQNLINHTFAVQVPVEKYGKTHPEYFALVDGERRLEMHGGGPQVCVTNPEVLDIVSQSVLEELRAHPGLRNVSVSQNDNTAYCRCAGCSAINEREGTPMGAQLAFVNAVAERVEREFPEAKVGTLAYSYTLKPPKTIRPRHNVQIQLCSNESCTLHAIDDPNCTKNHPFARDLAAWNAISDEIWVWNYNTNFHSYDLPFPNYRSIGPNVLYFLNNNVKGLFMQGNGNGLSGEFSDLRNYVMAMSMWDPHRGGWQRVEEFCRLHYGEAADPILAYLNLLCDTADAAGVHTEAHASALESGLDADFAERAYHLFNEAFWRLGQVENHEVIQERLEKAMVSVWKARVVTHSRLRYKDGQFKLDFPEPYQGIEKPYIQLAQKYGLERSSEVVMAEDYFQEVRAIADGVPALRLENERWTITVLPENNGKIGEMIYRPTGRDVVYGRLRFFTRLAAAEEWGVLGYDQKLLPRFDATLENNTVTLSGAADGRFSLVRTISFDETDPGVVRFRSKLTHLGEAPARYQMRIHPEYDIHTQTMDSEVLSVYIDDNGWKRVNDGWLIEKGPDEALLEAPAGNKIAFFNHEKKFGILQTWDPGEIQRPYLIWFAGRSKIHPELYTHPRDLAPNGTMEYGYTVEYLRDWPPKD